MTAPGGARLLHEVRQNALQDLTRAQAMERANARSGSAGAFANSADAGLKAGLKRNLASMQHLMPGGGVENSSGSNGSSAGCSSTTPAVSAALAAHQAAEAAAREKREAYEAWRDSMKKAKLAR